MSKLLSLIIAATLAAPAVASAAPANSVFHYDGIRSAIRGASITQAVLDGSIYPEIDRVHPYDRLNGTGTTVVTASGTTLATEIRDGQVRARREKVDYNRKRNRGAVQEHCRQAQRVSDASSEAKCGKGFVR